MVFVSSSIAGFEVPRNEVKEAVEALDLADTWLFEYSASASGMPPARQYLQAARDCDVFVLIVAGDVRQGTLAEYEEALADNPHKILPFFVNGHAGPAEDLWRRLRVQHTVIEVESIADLPISVAEAVHELVSSGSMVLKPLTAFVESLRVSRQRAIGLPAGVVLTRRLEDEPREIAQLLDHGRRTILVGPPGAGKSDAALSALAAAAASGELPTIVLPGEAGTDFEELVRASFNAVRFDPGIDLLRQYLLDGRVAVAVDGIDDLRPEDRDKLLASIDAASLRYPRTPILITTRTTPQGRLELFTVRSLAPLTIDDLDELFAKLGYEDPHPGWSITPRVRDLVELPFWAILVGSVGRFARSGIELLEILVAERLKSALRGDVVRQVRARDIVGQMAYVLRPRLQLAVADAFEILERMREMPRFRERYSSPSVEAMFDDVRNSGLVTLERDQVRYIHPLVAAYLAAEAAAEAPNAIDPVLDPDLATFAVLLLPEASPDRLRLIGQGGIEVASACLRMSGASRRNSDLTDDLNRFDEAYRRIRGALVVDADSRAVSILTLGNHVCLLRNAGEVPAIATGMDLGEWLGSPVEPVALVCWKRSPFLSASPDLVASQLALDDFKDRFRQLRPPGDRFAALNLDLAATAERARSKPEFAIAHAIAERDARRALVRDLRLIASRWPIPAGQPHIRIIGSRPNIRYVVVWGHEPAAVESETVGDAWSGRSIADLTIDPAVLAYHELEHDLEVVIGSSMASHASRTLQEVAWSL